MSTPGKRTVSLALALILLVVGVGAGAGITYVSLLTGGSFNSGLCSSGRTLTMGLLTDLTDGLSAQGVRAKEAAIIAVNDINSYLANGQGAASSGVTPCNLKFAVSVSDYALDTAKALTDLQAFAASGVQVVVGPLNSGAIIGGLLSYANSNHIVIISPSSTSVALAIPKDYLFRTAPNDRWQGMADATMLNATGANAAIVLQRHDTYGDALANATAADFNKLVGGSVTWPTNTCTSTLGAVCTIQYDTTVTDFTTIIGSLNTAFNAANGTATHQNRVAIDAISFEEFNQLAYQVSVQYPKLVKGHLPGSSTVPAPHTEWTGTDGESQDTVISGNSTIDTSTFRLPSTIYGFPNTTRTQTLDSEFSSSYSGDICDNYCRGTYDDMWLGALATLSAGSYDGTKIQAVMLQTADNYFGVTGSNALEASGDRVASIYQIYKIVKVGTTNTWQFAGTWDAPAPGATGFGTMEPGFNPS
jgi:branched-chain amino acid transport system substrate-binding protein